MEQSPTTQGIERERTPEKGANVLISIELIRHPEKDFQTGSLSEKGKADFLDKLKEEHQPEQYDTTKFYVTPLKRGQEAKEPIQIFMDDEGIETKIRDKKELGVRMEGVGNNFKQELDEVLREKGLITDEDNTYTEKQQRQLASYDTPSKNYEHVAIELLLDDYFDENFPDSSLTGKDIANQIDGLIKHFADLAHRIKSGSKIKLVLISHSGVIEYLTKEIFLRNNPELSSKEVKTWQIGGLVDYMEGPSITIQSDETGEQKIGFKFKDLDLDYKHE